MVVSTGIRRCVLSVDSSHQSNKGLETAAGGDMSTFVPGVLLD
jgi:hypothetical protein